MKSNHLSRSGTIRRRLLILLAAAVAIPVIWFFVTELEYTTYAWVRVPKRDMPKEEWEKFREEQVAHVLSDLVLDAALELELQGSLVIAELDSLKYKKDKKAWLRENLKVGYIGGSDILIINLSTKNPKDVYKILVAVSWMYKKKVLAVYREEDTRRYTALEDAYKDMEKQIAAKKKALAEQPDEASSSELERMEEEYVRMGIELKARRLTWSYLDSMHSVPDEPPKSRRVFRWNGK